MKIISLILAAFVLFLAVKPGIDLLSLQSYTKKTCCSRQCTPISKNVNSQEQSSNNDCDEKACNPFQVCSTCVLECFNIPLFRITKPTVFSKEKFIYQSIFTSQFAPDFWQPPKIV